MISNLDAGSSADDSDASEEGPEDQSRSSDYEALRLDNDDEK